MAEDFNDLIDRMDPARRNRIAAKVEEVHSSPLYQLRKALQFTQEQIGDELGVGQAAVSRLERRSDMYISTLRRFVGAMGGELEIRARFRDGDVVIDELGTVATADAVAAHLAASQGEDVGARVRRHP